MSKKKNIEKPMLTDYEHDAMWMSYRYAIGRNTTATSHAGHMVQNVYGRIPKDQLEFDVYDMRREIAYHLHWEFNFDMSILIPQEYCDPFKALIEFEKTLTKEEKEIGLLNILKDNRVVVLFEDGIYKFELHDPIHTYELRSLNNLLVWANAANALDPNKHHMVTTKFSGEEKTYDAFEYITYDKINGFHISYTAIDNYLENPLVFTYISKQYITKIDGKDYEFGKTI